MQFFQSLLLIFFIISAVLLVLVVFVQDDQGEGMGGIFAGGSGTPFGGQSSNILKKTTSTISVIFFISALAFGIVSRSGVDKGLLDELDSTKSSNTWADDETINENTDDNVSLDSKNNISD